MLAANEEVTAVPDKTLCSRVEDPYKKYLLKGETPENTLMLGFEYEVYPLVAKIKPACFPTSYRDRSDGGPDWVNQNSYNKVGAMLEVRSSVGSLAYHKKEAALFLENKLNEYDPSAKNSGGIHVHIEKKNLSKDQISRVFKLLHSPDNLIELFLISGRSPKTFRTWTRTQGTDKPNLGYEGRCIIGENKGYGTLEFRLFHSHPKYLMLALEMADSMWAWANSHSAIEWVTPSMGMRCFFLSLAHSRSTSMNAWV